MVLKGIFLPFISPSHLVPVVDIARIFAMEGVDVTIITTPANAAVFQSSIDRDCIRGRSIRTHVVKFPQVPGLPQGLESFNASTPADMVTKIGHALSILEGPFRQLFRDIKPDFIVSDMFYPWSVDAADELGIPRLIYVGGTYFAHCAMDSLERFEPHTKVGSDDESFLIPGLPHEFEMTRSQIPDRFKAPDNLTYLMKTIKESEKRSYGSVFKSFYAFEGAYEDHYRKIMGTKSWNLGPISSWVNQDASDKASRGSRDNKAKEEQVEEGKDGSWLAWLDSKKEGSVLYVCFGSMNNFPTTQLGEIAHALEDSGHDFIWVVGKTDEGETKGFVQIQAQPLPHHCFVSFFSGLSFYTTQEQLKKLFSPFGLVTQADLALDPITKRPKGFGFVSFKSEIEAEKACKAMNGRIVNGRLILVEPANEK